MWRTQKKGRRRNCTAVPTEPGWYRWVTASAVLAMRRRMDTVKVRGCLDALGGAEVCLRTHFREVHFSGC